VVAKVLEPSAKDVFTSWGIISGHTLKHVAAGVATWWLVSMFGGNAGSKKINR